MFLDFWGLTSLVHLSPLCRLPWLNQLEWVSAFCSLSRANLSCSSFLRSITWLSFLVFFLAQVPPDCNKHPSKCGTVFCSLRWVKKKKQLCLLMSVSLTNAFLSGYHSSTDPKFAPWNELSSPPTVFLILEVSPYFQQVHQMRNW